MSKFSPLDFQIIAIEKLTKAFQKLWQHSEPQRHLVFKSPTGSGKTFMVTNFLHGLNSLPNWDYDKAIIWITFSDSLAMQSKEKFKEYFNTNLENNLLTIEDFEQGKLHKNDILFVNWQKLVSKSAKNRILRRPDDANFHKEQGYYFEDVTENTIKDGREIIMVIDESHTHLSPLAQKSVVDVVNPKVIINVSATPKPGTIPNREDEDDGLGAYVYVKREDVVAEGLIKEKIAIQTDEDIKKFIGRDFDELLLDLAIEKKKELEEAYQELSKEINPLVLIQLPNDDHKHQDSGQKTKEQIVLEYLTKKKVNVENKVALWFDGKQKNMEFITQNESDVDFMLFKQAAGTGWDCPRAHILIMFREISSATFYTQTIGRILRMAEPHRKEEYKNSSRLRTGYLFTNYKRNEVGIPDQSDKNKPFIYTSKRKEGISNIENLNSDFISRVDYGDLVQSSKFQMSFFNSMNDYFGIDKNELISISRTKLEKKGVGLEPKLTNHIVIDAEFFNYDKLSLEFSKKGQEKEYEISRNDVEKLFTYWCLRLLEEQTDAQAKVLNVSRSWSPLKSALRVWFKRALDTDSNYYYRVFIADINKEQASVFRQALTKALKDYYPIKKESIQKRKKEIEERDAPLFEIKEEYNYTEDFSELTMDEGTSIISVVQPFYLRKVYKGRNNELKFIKYLEKKEKFLEWWFKNGENSKEYYCLKYFNTSTKEEALFYPDWILKFIDGRIGIFDTKSGFTAQNPEGRAEGLADKILILNEQGGNFMGGLVVLENNQWYYFINDKHSLEDINNKAKEPQGEYKSKFNYEYTKGKLSDNWKPLENLFE